jgi:beta-galactosidase
MDLCYCPSCEERFRVWLKEKYGDIDTLNCKWGNTFWSQGYRDFSEIQAPKITVTGCNPSGVLDWKRFCSDLIIEFHKFQSDILRAASPEKFITQNMMGFAEKVNYFDLADDLEFSSHDQYPIGHFHPVQNISRADELAASLDFIRGTKNKPFWIMEQQSGISGWDVLGRAPKPGQLGMWASQAVAHGADAIVFFRWRTCTMGTEQYWHGILPHSGIPGRYYEELKAFSHKTKPLLKELQGTMPKANVAFVFSYDQQYAIGIQPHHPDMSYIGHLMSYYTAFFDRNIPVDFIHEKSDFSRYDLVVAPLQYLMTPELEKKYKDYVQKGGNLVLTMRAGVKDDTNLCRTEVPLPAGELGELVGVEVHEYDCLREVSGWVQWDGKRYSCEKWCDIIKLAGAKALALYDFEFYAGSPVITANSYGDGKAYYVGTEPGAELAARLAEEFIADIGLQPLGETPKDVEIAHRAGDGKTYVFVINHTDSAKTIHIPKSWTPYYECQTNEIKPFSVDVYTTLG